MRPALLPLLASLLLTAEVSTAQQRPESLIDRYHEQEREAFEHFERRDWPNALAAFERQIALFAENPRPYYNIACVHALQGDAARASAWLEIAIGHGWRDDAHMAKDPDLDRIRGSAEYARAFVRLMQARAEDPDPLPRTLVGGGGRSAESARSIVVASEIEERIYGDVDLPFDEGRIRRRLFPLYDYRMALLGRYLDENGDARDADVAARERVRTALLYLSRADRESANDAPLIEAAARLAVAAAEQFVRRCPGSPRLPEVLFWRARAETMLGRDATPLLTTVAADHPDTEWCPRALVELCALLAEGGDRDALARAYDDLDARFGEVEWVALLMRSQLSKARLLARGLPGGVVTEGGAPSRLPRAGAGLTAYLFVSPRIEECAAAVAALRHPALRLVVLSTDGEEESPDATVAAWLRANASGLDTVARAGEVARRCWLDRLPTVIVADATGRVRWVDPTPEELASLPKGG